MKPLTSITLTIIIAIVIAVVIVLANPTAKPAAPVRSVTFPDSTGTVIIDTDVIVTKYGQLKNVPKFIKEN